MKITRVTRLKMPTFTGLLTQLNFLKNIPLREKSKWVVVQATQYQPKLLLSLYCKALTWSVVSRVPSLNPAMKAAL